MKWFSHQPGKVYLLLAPSLIFLLVFVLYGVLRVFMESLNGMHNSQLWTFSYYQKLLGSASFWTSLFISLKITLLATGLSLIIGIIITRVLFQYFSQLKWKILVWVPMLVPHFVAAYMIYWFFAPTGWISGLFYQLGFIKDWSKFPLMVNDRDGIGIILTYVWKQVPFVVLMLLPTYYQLDFRYAAVVRTLGGRSWDVFKTTEWPWLFPVVVETGIILVAFIIAAFEVPYLLGVTYPKMLPVLVYQWFFAGDWSNRPMAMAAMALITLAILVMSFLAFRWSHNLRLRLVRGR